MTERRADGRRLGESLAGDASLLELQAQRRLGETIRDVERRLLERLCTCYHFSDAPFQHGVTCPRGEAVPPHADSSISHETCSPHMPRCIGSSRGGACNCDEDPWAT